MYILCSFTFSALFLLEKPLLKKQLYNLSDASVKVIHFSPRKIYWFCCSNKRCGKPCPRKNIITFIYYGKVDVRDGLGLKEIKFLSRLKVQSNYKHEWGLKQDKECLFQKKENRIRQLYPSLVWSSNRITTTPVRKRRGQKHYCFLYQTNENTTVTCWGDNNLLTYLVILPHLRLSPASKEPCFDPFSLNLVLQNVIQEVVSQCLLTNLSQCDVV